MDNLQGKLRSLEEKRKIPLRVSQGSSINQINIGEQPVDDYGLSKHTDNLVHYLSMNTGPKCSDMELLSRQENDALNPIHSSSFASAPPEIQ